MNSYFVRITIDIIWLLLGLLLLCMWIIYDQTLFLFHVYAVHALVVKCSGISLNYRKTY